MTFATEIGEIASGNNWPPSARDRLSAWWRQARQWARAGLGEIPRLRSLPPIVVGRMEHHELNVLAMASPHHDATVSDALFYELDRAEVVPDHEVEHGIIRMGSTVTYRTSTGSPHRVSLVYPAEVDADTGRISVLSPVGAALIGLREGQSMSVQDEDGGNAILTVVSVQVPTGSRSPEGNTVAGTSRRP